MFQEADPLNHGVFFKNPEKKLPRALFFEDPSSFEILNYLNSTEISLKQPISKIWFT